MKLKTLWIELKTLRGLLAGKEILEPSPARVESYRREMASTGKHTPLSACFDGNDYWLFDGYHRLAAMKSMGYNAVQVRVYIGTRRDALRRYVKDKLKSGGHDGKPIFSHCLRLLSEDPEWSNLNPTVLSRYFDRKPAFFEALRLYQSQGKPGQLVRLSFNKHGSINLHVLR